MLSFNPLSASAIALLTFTIPVLATAVTASNATLQACLGPQPTTKYPSKCEIGKIFDTLGTGNFSTFFAHLSPTVHWTLMGTHPLAGQYTNRTIFATDALQRLDNTLDPKIATSLVLTNIVGGGSDDWSTVELHAKAVCKNGLPYDNMFSWTTRWSTDAIIQETHAYFDSALVTRVLLENEVQIYNYTQARSVLEVGPVGSNCKAGV